MQNVLWRILVLVGITLLFCGCGGGQDQWKEVQQNVKRAQEFESKKMKGIADDKALTDPQAFKKYLDSSPEVQTNLPKGVAPWWATKPVEGGTTFEIRDVLQTQWEGSTADERYQRERDFIRNRLLMCKRMLEDLKSRKLLQVGFTLFTKQGSEDKYIELFRIVVTQADLTKFENLPAKAEAGGVFDTRGPKIGTLGKVELNRFPELDYVKRTK